jgi:hypothetical protein
MRSNLPFILSRIPANLAESGTDVIIGWDEITGGTVDPVTRSIVGGTVTPQTATVKAFLHFVGIATSGVRQFNEMEAGDCIADFAPDVDLDGKTNLTFTINGEVWMAKELSQRLAKTWDVQAQGQKLFRSVLLRKAT